MTMVLGIGIMKHIRKLLGFYIKCLPLIFFIAITVKLQHQSLNIISAYEQINDVQNEFELLRINIDEEFYTSFV